MGDRCSMSVRVRIDQIEKFCKVTGLCDPDSFEFGADGKTADAEIEEVNYGGYDPLVQATRAGVVFVGNHGSGSDYGPARFASDGRGYDERETNFCGHLTVTSCEDGTLSEGDVEELQQFVAFFKKAEKALDAATPAETEENEKGKA